MVEEARPPEPEGHRPADAPPEHADVAYETKDASFAWILGISVGGAVLAVIILCLVWLFFKNYQGYQAAIKKSPFPLGPAPTNPNRSLPRGPRLEQVNRLAGIERGNVYLREEVKEEDLHKFGRTDEPGYVRIPIEDAMKLVPKTLPARPESQADRHRENGLVDSGASNSGRIFREKPPWYEH
jgi:hypothetical protein